jgi:branched-chain amino acid transport system substrate-binding protein
MFGHREAQGRGAAGGTVVADGPRRHRLALVALLLPLSSFLFIGCTTRSIPLEDAPLPFRQAEDNFRLGNYEKAVRGYQVFLDSAASEDYDELVPRAYYRMAMSEYRRGRYTECLAALDRMERRLPDKQWPQVDALRGDAELARGNPISALRWWEEGWKIADGEEKREARQHIADALDRMDPSSLARAKSVLTTEEMQALVDTRLRGVPIAAPSAAAGTTTSAPPPLPASSGGTPVAGSESPLGDDRGGPAMKIAVLLPLSGQYATYGQRSLNGIKLALGAQADGLVVRDDKGEPPVGRAAFDELATDATIGAVIGPLRSKVAETVAPRAEHDGLPLVVLSQQEGISGRWVVQPAMTAERQATELADYAVGQGLRKFGILYPNDPYGIALSQAFKQSVEQRGGQVVGSITYDASQKEFSVELLSVDKWVKGDGMQAVFIPDFASTAIPLATQVRHAQPGVVLLGSNGWNDPAALGPAADTIDGAVFVDGFFPSSQRRATQEFVAAYKAAYGSTPEILEAQAYDAGKLVAAALQSGAHGRPQVIAALQMPRTFEGAAGAVSVGPQGVQRQLFLLRIASGTISEIVPSRPAAAPAPPPVPVAGPAAVR